MLESIETKLKAIQKIAKNEIGENAFIGIQAFLGRQAEAGFVRVAVSNQGKDGNSYDSAMSRFVRLFGRSNLIFEYIKFKKYYEIFTEEEPQKGGSTNNDEFKLEISKAVYDALCSDLAYKMFVECINDKGKSVRKGFSNLLRQCVSNAMRLRDPDNQKKYEKIYDLIYSKIDIESNYYTQDDEANKEIAFWEFFSNIQHTLLFVRYLVENYSESGQKEFSGFSVLCESPNDSNGAVLVSDTPLSGHTSLRKELRDSLSSIINESQKSKKYEKAYSDTELRFSKKGENTNAADSELKSIFDGISNAYQLPSQKVRLRKQIQWAMTLTQEGLAGAVHENDPLEFYFLFGDETEIRDSEHFVFREFKESKDQIEQLGLPNESNPEEIHKRLEICRKALAHEHFPWFSHGKHALFWSVSKEELYPIALVKLVKESWASLVQKAYTPNYVLDYRLPTAALVYASPHGAEAGVLSAKVDNETQLTMLQRQFQLISDDGEPQWLHANFDERNKLISEVLYALPSLKKDKSKIDRLVALTARAANDPRLGGTLVIAEDRNVADEFLSMGNHWKDFLEDNDIDDQLALFAHDGATILYPDGEYLKWQFRKLLMADLDWKVNGSNRKIRNLIEEFKLNSDWKWNSPFDWVGSRRFSSAIASFREGIDAVIVVSQDGDVVCWYHDVNRDEIVCHQVPKNGRPGTEPFRLTTNTSNGTNEATQAHG